MADRSSTPAPLLNLDTLIARPTVTIDGVPYEMYAPDELSILENRRLIRWGDQADAIEHLEEPTDEQLREYDAVLKKMADALVLAPDDVKARLTKQQRGQVGVTFLRLWLEMQERQADQARANGEAGREASESQETEPTTPTEPLETTGAN